MNLLQIQLCKALLTEGRYLRKTFTGSGISYTLYKGDQSPVARIPERTIDKLPADLLKRDRKGKLTINRSVLRRLHGNFSIKKHYKKTFHHAKS